MYPVGMPPPLVDKDLTLMSLTSQLKSTVDLLDEKVLLDIVEVLVYTT